MQTVQEFSLPATTGTFSLSMPEGALILSAQTVLGLLGPIGGKMWCLVETTASSQTRNFRLRTAGTEIPAEAAEVYIATFQAGLGLTAYHLFEIVG